MIVGFIRRITCKFYRCQWQWGFCQFIKKIYRYFHRQSSSWKRCERFDGKTALVLSTSKSKETCYCLAHAEIIRTIIIYYTCYIKKFLLFFNNFF